MTDLIDKHDSDSWAVDDARIALADWVQTREGAFYRWGGKGETLPREEWLAVNLAVPRCLQVYDCSGFTVAGLISIKLVPEAWLHTHNADRLFRELEPSEFDGVQPLDLAFYGRPPEKGNPEPRATHVMFFWMDGKVIGACGGNESTVTLETAARVGARVRYRSSHMYRSDFLGFRRLPSPKE